MIPKKDGLSSIPKLIYAEFNCRGMCIPGLSPYSSQHSRVVSAVYTGLKATSVSLGLPLWFYKTTKARPAWHGNSLGLYTVSCLQWLENAWWSQGGHLKAMRTDPSEAQKTGRPAW